MSAHSPKELVKESEWMRVYKIGPNELRYESKFLMDGLEVSPDFLKNRWENLTPEEQLDFALAFSAKPRFSAGDQEILTFLMECGSDVVCGTLATCLPKHSDRERVLRFLLERVVRPTILLANYYQALEILNDKRAVPVLRQVYVKYKEKIRGIGIRGLPDREAGDYLVCCGALAVLESPEEFATAIEEMLEHPDAWVKRRARQMCDEIRR